MTAAGKPSVAGGALKTASKPAASGAVPSPVVKVVPAGAPPPPAPMPLTKSKSKTQEMAQVGVQKLEELLEAYPAAMVNTCLRRTHDQILKPMLPILQEMVQKAWGGWGTAAGKCLSLLCFSATESLRRPVSAGQDACPLSFGGISEFSGSEFRKSMESASLYTCTVPFHWLGIHLFSHSSLLPSIGAVTRVMDHIFVVRDDDGNRRLDPSGVAKLEVRVRATSKVDIPMPGHYDFVDGDAARLAMGMAMVAASTSPTSVLGGGVGGVIGKELFTRALRPVGKGGVARCALTAERLTVSEVGGRDLHVSPGPGRLRERDVAVPGDEPCAGREQHQQPGWLQALPGGGHVSREAEEAGEALHGQGRGRVVFQGQVC